MVTGIPARGCCLGFEIILTPDATAGRMSSKHLAGKRGAENAGPTTSEGCSVREDAGVGPAYLFSHHVGGALRR